MKKQERNLLIGGGVALAVLYIVKPQEETMMGWLTGLGGLEDLFSAAEAGSEGGGAPDAYPMPELDFSTNIDAMEGMFGKLPIPTEGIPGLPGEPGIIERTIETIFEPIEEAADISGEMVKWGLVAGTGYLGYRGLKKVGMIPKRKPPGERIPKAPRTVTTTPTRSVPITNRGYYRATLGERAKWAARYKGGNILARIPRPVRVVGGAAGLGALGWTVYEFLFGGAVHAAGEEYPYTDPFTALAWVYQVSAPELFEMFPELAKARKAPTPTPGAGVQAAASRILYDLFTLSPWMPHITAADVTQIMADPRLNPSARPVQTPLSLPHISAATFYDPQAAQKARDAEVRATLSTMLG